MLLKISTLWKLNGRILVDDSYNSNPRALEGALFDLGRIPSSRRVAVLGDMLELGEGAMDFHRDIGQTVVQTGWNILITVGPLSRNTAEGALGAGMDPQCVHSFPDSEAAAAHILPLLEEKDFILVKGSRGIRMEAIVNKIRNGG